LFRQSAEDVQGVLDRAAVSYSTAAHGRSSCCELLRNAVNCCGLLRFAAEKKSWVSPRTAAFLRVSPRRLRGELRFAEPAAGQQVATRQDSTESSAAGRPASSFQLSAVDCRVTLFFLLRIAALAILLPAAAALRFAAKHRVSAAVLLRPPACFVAARRGLPLPFALPEIQRRMEGWKREIEQRGGNVVKPKLRCLSR